MPMDRSKYPADCIAKAQHLLELAGLASSFGDFRLAARLYEDARKWTAEALAMTATDMDKVDEWDELP